MRKLRVSSTLVLTLLVAFTIAADAKKPKYIHPSDVDWESILSGPPADDSPQHQQEIAAVLQWQDKRTAEDVKRCKTEASANAFIFSEVLGDWFKERSLPITASLMNQAFIDTNAVFGEAKAHWNRPRPSVADHRIHPCVHIETSPSYPSGHASRGIVWATLLAEIFPERRDDLMALGKRYGDDRVVAGIHWPSDVDAGQKLGTAIAKKLLDSPDFKIALEEAKTECLTSAH